MPSLYAKKRPVTPEELAACRRVASYFRRVAVPYLADLYDHSEPTEAKRAARYTPFVEFQLTFFSMFVERFDRRLTQSIRDFAAGRINALELKEIADEYIKAHTVVWLDGAPYWKVKELIDQEN